ncbi:MAG: N-acetyl-gamma-glutamyl-phosphate reductase, partial [Promethearchaeota archaeon]
RILSQHPETEICFVTSRKYAGKHVHVTHPHLEGKISTKFSMPNIDKVTKDIDFVFLAIPHGESQDYVPELLDRGIRVIDLSADFRLESKEKYEFFYKTHSYPELLKSSVYGLPELNKDKIRIAKLIAVPGCHASAAIYGLLPAVKNNLIKHFPIIIDSKTGSTGAGSQLNYNSLHPIRANVIRPYKVVGHRHTAEIEQTIKPFLLNNKTISKTDSFKIHFSAHAVDAVRGILSTIHVFLKENINEEREIYKAFRDFTKKNYFIRFIKKASGTYKLPDPKMLLGSNYCDIGFELDPLSDRLVILSALDNLVKGAAGNAVQCYNLACNYKETLGLDQLPIFPA